MVVRCVDDCGRDSAIRLEKRQILQRGTEYGFDADPKYALAHAALSTTWSAQGYDVRARDEAKKAFGLSAGLPRENRLAIEGQYRFMVGSVAQDSSPKDRSHASGNHRLATFADLHMLTTTVCLPPVRTFCYVTNASW